MRDCTLGVRRLVVVVRAVATGVDVTVVPKNPEDRAEVERRARLALARRRH